MEIILKQDIKGLGYKHDLVAVKNGYGRNFLIPQGLASLATESAKKQHAETMKQRSFKEEKLRKEAAANAEKLAGVSIKVGAKAGENGKIFGSVTNIQLADALTKAGYAIERKNIEIAGDGIKQLGNYTAKVRLYKEVAATINFEVIAE
ncbi:MAG: 50S ribosomal protein L9 [Bacteroidia bacterium]|nr:50S ribosomal protein L9 [Sphingobacteriaceae bacterium]MBK7311447.1 50S ribosomal protein L9 [Sphingobacteriaceae bacterium]MBK7818280.1 50S ribosomal protein L9 [Sphingobacteriaceae bacterium]MBP9067957.1 50S ribosomal protein L9 [Bacteroidia bacterium]